ncbi:acyl-CoA dehydrogenase family protein [Streptomyces sp. NPDC001940]|uniref:acyl-CoA dehydrogenase family protein n=1 Tax=unclassified Streptomyces TaxID=2593676 RepID=UPI00224CF840|nr:acyl-CoA dehydrogenase family protein [Streptomyces sp. NBC_00401]MCX5084769.1 acyl-CoA dehydrogenase family protein [Streptomyces sp. NBC_00401]
MFELTDRAKEYQEKLLAFMDERIYPAEPVYEAQMAESGDPHFHPPILEDLKADAKKRGLWNLFHPHPEWGPGLTNLEYAPLAEIMGRSAHLAPEATNCNAPDTGNMEVLTLFGTDEHKEKWLKPLLDGEIASAFAMTEPAVASSDATNIQLRMERDGDDYVLNGRKWWTSNALHKNCKVLIVMGKTEPEAATHRQQSMMVVPIDTPGVTVLRNLPVFGYKDREGHAEVVFKDVRVPVTALLAGEGDGFMISQARLGPGRIHHCMRAVGMAERALDLMIDRAQARTTFGEPVANRANVQDWIAEARIEIDMVRLLTLKAAYLMDTVGNRHARTEIAAIKVAAPEVALKVVDRAIQVHGGGGVSDDFPLASMYAHLRTLRLADGPDEVHKRTIAMRELRRREPQWGRTS